MKKILVLFFVLFLSQISQAASFDCAKAASKSEKQICADAQLSRLDEELAAAYDQAKQKLSADAQKLFVSGQRSWLKFHSSSCFFDQAAKAADKASSIRCQTEEYKARIAAIEQTGSVVLGMMIFPYFQGAFNANPKSEWRNISFDRREVFLFDGRSDLANALNAIIKPLSKVDSGDTGSTSESNVLLRQLSSDLVMIEERFDMSGGAYPVSGTNFQYFSKDLKRPLKIGDVFNSPQWKVLAQKKAQQQLKKKGVEGVDIFEIAAEQKDPFGYAISEKGFVLEDLLPHVARALDGADMPWKDFSKFLTPLGQQLSRVKTQ